MRRLPLYAVLAYVLGRAFAWVYLLELHPPAEFVYNDMRTYVEAALDLRAHLREPGLIPTLYPSGTAVYLGVLHGLDPSWALATVVQWLVLALIPVVVALLAFELFGATAAWVALLLASLHFPFVDLASYFLSENPFTLSLLASVWLFARAMHAPERRGPAWGLASGIAAGLALSFKDVLLPSAAATGAALAALAVKRGERRLPPALLAALAGLVLAFAPLAYVRSWRNQGFLGASAYRILMGYQGDFATFTWTTPGAKALFGYPVSYQRGLRERLDLPFWITDAPKNLELAGRWIREHPARAVAESARRAFWDLFYWTPWPTSATRFAPLASTARYPFWLLILAPACLHLARSRRRLRTLEASAKPELLLAMPVVGLMAAAFITAGEPRYRIPYDGLLIVLAAQFWSLLASRRLNWRPR